MKRLSIVLSVAVALMMASGTSAQQNQILVEVHHRTWTDSTLYDSGEDIDINVAQYWDTDRYYPDQVNIWDDPGLVDADIGAVSISGNRTVPIKVTISSGAFRANDPTEHEEAAINWAGIIADQTMRDQVWLDGSIKGDLTGSIAVGQIHGLYIDGTIYSSITASASPSGLFWLVAGAVDSSVSITSATKIGFVQTILSDMKGTVWAGTAIDNIEAEGEIGSVGVPVSITAANGNIKSVQADQIFANISAINGDVGLVNATVGGFIGKIDAINISHSGSQGFLAKGDVDLELTLSGSNAAIRDDFIIDGGNFTANSFIHSWSIGDTAVFQVLKDANGGGYVYGDITFTGNLSTQSPFTIDESLESTLTIGNNFMENMTIKGLSSNGKGLTGQVIINANNNSSIWVSGKTVVVGTTNPITLTGDEYTATAASLGGGAVGLVPFSTHRESCSPVHGTVKKGTPASITLQFYGPVIQKVVGTDMPVKVYRGDFGTGNNEVDVTSGFAVVMAPGGDPRKVKIVPSPTQFRPKYRYRLVPITTSPGEDETTLLCDDLLASGEVPVKGRDYWVDVDITFAMLDMGGNSWVDAPDLVLWAITPEDFNGDGNTDTQDLQLIVDNLGQPVD